MLLVAASLAVGVLSCSDSAEQPAESGMGADGAQGGTAGLGGGQAGSGVGGAMNPAGAGAGAGANLGGSSGNGSESGGNAGVSGGVGGTNAAAGGNPGASGGAGGGVGGEVGSPSTYTKPAAPPADEDGSQLWLRYPLVSLADRHAEYTAAFTHLVEVGEGATLQAAQSEVALGLSGLLGVEVPVSGEPGAGAVVMGTPETSSVIAGLGLGDRLGALGSEGYLVEQTADGQTTVAANSEIGVLYGAFALLRHLQQHQPLGELQLMSSPKVQYRVLNHWDNENRTVERGYAGLSLWEWSALPGTLSPRYTDYARANASIGINGTVLNNVNANARILQAENLEKVNAIAEVFRPYGIQTFLTARFSAPIEIGGLDTADPLDADVQGWWVDKANEIYALIPDFGGFLVKANSEGQPGPQDYGRNHADGANMLAEALAPHGGVVMWRAFVYSENSAVDRIRQGHDEFKPLDGAFLENVFVQPKNGPLDFQPREPFHPLLGDMPQTPLALELQITKEYLGQDTHLAYLGPLYEEVLQADTFANGEGSTVARVVDGSLHSYSMTAMAGVSNVGDDVNWTGSHFNQANWYVYGRMAWDPDITAPAVAEEWTRQTFSNDPAVVEPVVELMMGSHQTVVDYMTPMGLVHIMAASHHYGPGPWVDNQGRAEWNSTYYHNADETGIGFDRTASGSNAVEQYMDPVGQVFADRATVPEDFLLFFHHVGWQESVSSGRTVWEELVHRYSSGVDRVGEMREQWKLVQGYVDEERFSDVSQFLLIQHYDARWWRDSCLLYFADVAGLEFPAGYAPASNDLDYYRGLTCPRDTTKPRCEDLYDGDLTPLVLP